MKNWRVIALGIVLIGAVAGAWWWVDRTLNAATGLYDEIETWRTIPQTGMRILDMSGDDAIAEMRRLAHMQLPDVVQDAHFARQEDRYYWLRFTATPDAMDAFLQSTCLDAAFDQSVTFAYDADDAVIALMEWWTPTQARAACQPTGQLTFSAALAREGAAQTVYVEISRR